MDMTSEMKAQEHTAETWYVGSMNDGLFIINTPPRPSTDEVWHDRPDGPTMVIPVSGLKQEVVNEIVAEHNKLAGVVAKMREALEEAHAYLTVGGAPACTFDAVAAALSLASPTPPNPTRAEGVEHG